MARAGLRVVVGLSMALAAAALFAPFLRSADAQTRDHVAARTPQTLPTPTIVTTPPTVTTAPPVTAPPFSVTPTTRRFVPVTQPRVPGPTTTVAATTTTSTTIAPIPAGAPPPVTLPLASEPQSANISPIFPIMSGIGFFALVALLTAQWFLTRPGRRGPTL